MATCCIHCGVEEGELHMSDCPALRQAFDRLTRERDEALAEVERLRTMPQAAWVRLLADAERYRWLRTFATWVNEDYESIHYRWNAGEFESVDAAIDAAREGK